MKIYLLKFDLSLVVARLKKFRLGEFNSSYPMIFVDATDPDDACYRGHCKLVETLLKQNGSKETALLIKEIMHDVKIKKVFCKDEEKL